MNKKIYLLDDFMSAEGGYVVVSALLILMVLFLNAAPVRAAIFSVDTANSFFFGQRGAGIVIDVNGGSTDFGHLNGNIDTSGVNLSGQGLAETDFPDGGASESLGHGIDVTCAGNDHSANIDLYAALELEGGIYNGLYEVTVMDNNFSGSSYADATAQVVLNIGPGVGESMGQSVLVHVQSFAESAQGYSFQQETGVAAGYPNNFRVLHNGEEVFNAGDAIISPNGYILDDLIIDAVIGDTITVDAAVWARLGGTELFMDEEIMEYTWIYMNTDLYIESAPVPIPGAVWLMGSGLVALAAVRRRKKVEV